MATAQDDHQDHQAAVLSQITPLVIIDGEGCIRGVVLAQSALAPAELYERLCERAESWLASRAGAELRAHALEEALRVGALGPSARRISDTSARIDPWTTCRNVRCDTSSSSLSVVNLARAFSFYRSLSSIFISF